MAIAASDFVPPIILKIIRKIKRVVQPPPENPIRGEYNYPFNYLPYDIKPRLIMDVGANLGGVSRAALSTFPEARLICLEPVSSTAQILKENLRDFSDRVELHELALSSKNGKRKINLTPFHGANSLESQTQLYNAAHPQLQEEGSELINLITLDQFYRTFVKRKIDILKIDVEGHEMEVLQGGGATLKNNVEFIIIEVSFYRDKDLRNQKFIQLFSKLRNLGFYLVNVFDLYNAKGHESSLPVLVEQFDCVFRNKKFLKTRKNKKTPQRDLE